MNASTTLIVTPARTTIMRFQTGWRSNARAGSTGTSDLPPSRFPETPSSSTPAIFTYPPSGSHEIQYSVSPRRQLKMGRPKRSEEHTSELQSQSNLVCRLLLEKKKKTRYYPLTGPL